MMTVDELLAYYGGNKAKLARALGVSRPTVHRWIQAGKVPLARQYQAEVITGHRLKAERRVKR